MNTELKRHLGSRSCIGSVLLDDGRIVPVQVPDGSWQRADLGWKPDCDSPIAKKAAELAAREEPWQGGCGNIRGIRYRRVEAEHVRVALRESLQSLDG